MVKLKLHEPRIILQGPVCEEAGWGYYQFPRIFALPDGRLAAAIHVEDDLSACYGREKKWLVSDDEGRSWTECGPEIKAMCGYETASGERLWPVEQPVIDLKDYEVPPFRLASYSLPTDSTETMQNSTASNRLPEGIGKFTGAFGETYRTYLVDCLPTGLMEKKWKFLRWSPETGRVTEEDSPLDWPYMSTHSLFDGSMLQLMRPNLWGNIKLAPDGSLWAAHYDGYGANPENGAFYTVSTCYFFRSIDDGRSWKLMSYIDYHPDIFEDKLAYFRDGFDEPDLAFMPDGSMIVLMRTAGVFHGAPEWGPSYLSRSTDGGKTWQKPWRFDDIGVLPQLRSLKCGVTLAVYGRPGIYVRATEDPSGLKWDAPVELMTPEDRSPLMNRRPERPNFHQWAGSCCNMTAAVIGDNKIVIAYSDFYVPDEKGIKRKTCLSQVIEVV